MGVVSSTHSAIQRNGSAIVPPRRMAWTPGSECWAVVARMRAEIAAEVGTPAQVFVPPTRLPVAEGEVD